MKISECFEFGVITKSHGLKGEFNVVIDVDSPSFYQGLDAFLLDRNGTGVPFMLEYFKLKGSAALAKLEGVDNRDGLEEFIGQKLYLPLSALPPLEEGEYYLHDLIGFTMIEGDKEIGPVTSLSDNGAYELLFVDYQGHEVIVPLVEDVIQKVDKSNKQVIVSLPEGLLDVYTEEEN